MTRPERHSVRSIVAAALPGSIKTIPETTALSKGVVRKWLKEFHEAREVHIVSWERPERGGLYIPTYESGPGEDAPCKFKPLSDTATSRAYRKRARKDGRWELRLAKARANYWADRARKRRDPMFEALFGPPKSGSKNA